MVRARLLAGCLACALLRASHAFVSVASRLALQSTASSGSTRLQRQASLATAKRTSSSSSKGRLSMFDMDFAAMPQRDFNFYVGFMALAFQGILPYTIMANGKAFEDAASFRIKPAVTAGEDATVSNQALLLLKENLRLQDVIGIVSRFSTFEELQDPGTDGKPMSNFLRRETFKANVRSLQPKAWPVDESGAPAAGTVLAADSRQQLRAGDEIPEEALDAVFDVFSGSRRAYIADRFKVDNALARWRKDANTFDVAAFEQNLLTSRLTYFSVYVFLIAVQAVCWYTFFINPIVTRYVLKS